VLGLLVRWPLALLPVEHDTPRLLPPPGPDAVADQISVELSVTCHDGAHQFSAGGAQIFHSRGGRAQRGRGAHSPAVYTERRTTPNGVSTRVFRALFARQRAKIAPIHSA
jgi:hypothetical protein